MQLNWSDDIVSEDMESGLGLLFSRSNSSIIQRWISFSQIFDMMLHILADLERVCSSFMFKSGDFRDHKIDDEVVIDGLKSLVELVTR